MSILNQIPKPTINLDFVQMQENRNTLSALRSVVEQIPDSAVDFSALRASKKYTENRLGVIAEADENVPALSFDGGVAKGFLAEGGATNLLLHSEAFNEGYWQRSRLNTTDTPPWINVAVAPDGTQTAEKIIANTEINTHYVRRSSASVAGVPNTLSIHAKRGEYSKIFISGNVGNTGVNAIFDLNNGTVVSGVASAVIKTDRNGWYRCSITITPVLGSTDFFDCGIVDDSNNLTFAGNNSDGIFLWGAQLETGSVASSYIPTTTATVARSADNFRITDASGAIGQTSGVIAVDVDVRSIAESRVIFNAISDPTNNNSIRRIGLFPNGNAYVQIGLTNVQVSEPTTGLARILLRYDSDGFSIVRNGIVGGSSAVTPSADIASVITLGVTQAVGAPLNDSIRSVKIWNTSDWCTDEIAQLLTRP